MKTFKNKIALLVGIIAAFVFLLAFFLGVNNEFNIVPILLFFFVILILVFLLLFKKKGKA